MRFLFVLFLLFGWRQDASSLPHIKKRTFDASYGVDVFVNALEDGEGYWWFQPAEYRQPPAFFDGNRFDRADHVFGDRGLQLLFSKDYYSEGSMVDAKGIFWWCGSKGVYRFKHGKVLECLNKQLGLPSDSVILVEEDFKGLVWIATVKGFDRLKWDYGKWVIQKKRPRLQLKVDDFLKNYAIETFWSNNETAPRFYLEKTKSGDIIYGFYSPKNHRTILEWVGGKEGETCIGRWEIPGQVINLESDYSGILAETGNKEIRSWLLLPQKPAKKLEASLGKWVGWLNDHEALFQVSRSDRKQLFIHTISRLDHLEVHHSARALSNMAPKEATLKKINGYPVLLGSDNFDPFSPLVYQNGNWVSSEVVFPNIDLSNSIVFQRDANCLFIAKKQIREITQVHINPSVQVIPFPRKTNGLFIQNVHHLGKSLVVQINDDNPLAIEGLGFCYQSFTRGAFSTKGVIKKSRLINSKPFGGSWFIDKDTSSMTFMDGAGDSIRIALPKSFRFHKSIVWTGWFLGMENNGWAWLVDTGSRKARRFKMPTQKPLATYINEEGIQFLDSIHGLYGSSLQNPEQFSLITTTQKTKPLWFSQDFPAWHNRKAIYLYYHGKIQSHPIPDTTYAKIRTAQKLGDRVVFMAGNIFPYYRDILCWDGNTWALIPLPQPIRAGLGFLNFPEVCGHSDALYMLNEGQLMEYRKQSGWKTLCHLAEWMGFVWTSAIVNQKLYATGWSRNLVEIDLAQFQSSEPKVNFHRDSIQALPHPCYPYGKEIIIRWKGTEFLSSKAIRYRSRIVRLNGASNADWVDEGGNEARIISFLPSGSYRFELMAKGDQDQWSRPISFFFIVTPPWYELWYWRVIFVLGGAVVILLVVFLNQARLKRINLRLQQKINSATEEIRTQNQQLEHQHQEILDSIEYAKRIQGALLPGPKMIKEYLVDSFILYLPKDVVAGDFYWMERKGPWLWFAVCDCTGHGVPGAMVSVVCHNALNRAVNEFSCTLPGEILDKVAELVLDNFSNDQDVKDGMDASLCAWNLDTQTIYWSGANNPLWIMGKQGLSIVKPDKQAIGQIDNRVPYTTHQLSLESGDVLYLFTDGFADQFGGPKGKKLTRSKFQEWLQELGHLDMNDQRKRLLDQHLEYRGNLPQVDDVCIMGLRPFS